MSSQVDLTEDEDQVSVCLMDSANVLRFWIGYSGLLQHEMSEPIPIEKIKELFDFLSTYLYANEDEDGIYTKIRYLLSEYK